MENDKSPHILNASSNLLGLCFVVLTALKVFTISHRTFIDELTLAAIVLFTGSCLFSFLSIRSNKPGNIFETIADYLFLAGLFALLATTILFSVGSLG